MLDDPKGNSPAGTTSCAPLFHDIAAYAMRAADVPPSATEAPIYDLYVSVSRVVLPPVAPTPAAASLRPRQHRRDHPGGTVGRTGRLSCRPPVRPGRHSGRAANAGCGRDRLTGITLRAQDVRPGDLFAALPGSQDARRAVRRDRRSRPARWPSSPTRPAPRS